MKKNISLLFLLTLFVSVYPLSEQAQLKGFVDLATVDQTIRVSLRYSTDHNFVGVPINGYNKSIVLLTNQAAQALHNVQEEVKKDGYSLVVYDAYRPQQAVDHFITWSQDIAKQIKKNQYYPRVDKKDVFKLGYVARRSGHSRGSTVDVTLIKLDNQLQSIKLQERVLLDGFKITYLDDGTLDMGSSFDLFDQVSHCENNLIQESYKKNRTYLKTVMTKHGFKNYACEWWHFTLHDEPYPADHESSYFNFVIE